MRSMPDLPAPKGDPDSGLSYWLLPSQQRGEAESDPPSLTSRVRLEDLLEMLPRIRGNIFAVTLAAIHKQKTKQSTMNTLEIKGGWNSPRAS